jgi:hypothetical protein
MGALLNAVLKQRKIKLLNVTAEVRPERIHHLYMCERQGCDFEFSVSHKLEDQSPIVCPNCYKDDCLRELGDAAVMRGDLADGF